ncbi:3-oxo-5-alpha-steroid 4-dehydrogenase-domain-containing protein [Chytridium lagenaria]|nr:3-oxo-5-alpha-steroid 4-dehydrogenase-domain-containing protein [Chytridium lagenaria]
MSPQDTSNDPQDQQSLHSAETNSNDDTFMDGLVWQDPDGARAWTRDPPPPLVGGIPSNHDIPHPDLLNIPDPSVYSLHVEVPAVDSASASPSDSTQPSEGRPSKPFNAPRRPGIVARNLHGTAFPTQVPAASPAVAAAAIASMVGGAVIGEGGGTAILKPRATEMGFQDEERREMVLFTLFCAIGIVIGYLEASGVFNAPYSKFRRERWSSTLGYMSTRLGMLMINMSTLLLILVAYLFYGDPTCPFHLVTLGFYLVFYFKRILEVLFVHSYSGPVSVAAVIYMTVGNLAMTALSCVSILFTHEKDDSNFSVLLLPIPLILFGLAGNFYHHVLLARLRRNVSKSKKTMSRPYRIPRGGLFYHTTCPHYLLEILAWIGFSVTVHRPAIYGQVMYILCKLAGRAFQTRRWWVYRNIPGYPAQRTSIIPFII